MAPAEGWSERRPVGGVLDSELAWRTWERARLDLDLDLVKELLTRRVIVGGPVPKVPAPQLRIGARVWMGAGRGNAASYVALRQFHCDCGQVDSAATVQSRSARHA